MYQMILYFLFLVVPDGTFYVSQDTFLVDHKVLFMYPKILLNLFLFCTRGHILCIKWYFFIVTDGTFYVSQDIFLWILCIKTNFWMCFYFKSLNDFAFPNLLINDSSPILLLNFTFLVNLVLIALPADLVLHIKYFGEFFFRLLQSTGSSE